MATLTKARAFQPRTKAIRRFRGSERGRLGIGASHFASPIVTEFGRLVALVEQLKYRVEALEAESVPLHRSRKCPRCHRLSLAVVATRPHPELGHEGIEQHDVRCGCGYQGSRLYDPHDFLR